MDRKTFFKKLAIGAAVILSAPKILAKIGKPRIPEDFSKRITNMRPSNTPLDTIIRSLENPKQYMEERSRAYRKFYEGDKWSDNAAITD